LAAPLALLQQLFAEHPNTYVTDQVYLDPCSDPAHPEPDAVRR
jgi:uncharacterized protein YbgA (DUF1722 family)